MSSLRAIPALSGNEIIFLSWTLTQCESIKAVKVLLGVGAGARHSWCIVARMRKFKLPLASQSSSSVCQWRP